MGRRVTGQQDRRRRKNRFVGMEGLREFLQRQCTITHRRTDVVRCRDLYHAYCMFCATTLHPVASVVNVGRYLGGLQVRASRRLGGCNGRRQEYAYVGLCLNESLPRAPKKGPPSPPTLTPVSPAPPSSTSSSYDCLSESMDFLYPGVSRPPREDDLDLLDAFLRENVERTGSAEDAVPVGELHAAYRRLCRARGVTPQPAAHLSSHLTQREGVAISRLNFETVKRAYQGLRWTTAALDALTPSRRHQPTPCSSCEAGRLAPSATECINDGVKNEGVGVGTSGACSPWTNEHGLGDEFSLKLWDDDDDSGEHLQNLQPTSPTPQPTAMSPPSMPDLMLLQDTDDLAQLIEEYNSTSPSVF
ncbi:uncharacterized protein LOC126980479 isoform X1 [Eriocheir sinensis]|uniref:uncharacterized protein LOC126980479 isoform X1 n=1 Tax=Eriocheir sinensis TaxID=95602 RepID=UPI0021C971CE|nr:uncharacterized protein LOC126980479 isoform X1 [Eriocheir sinensis]XP_050686370.1 uncharacterized protein LOC126980479 isoform X1 [Eriocheir sinensis]